MEEILQRKVQLLILGAGDKKYEEPLEEIAGFGNPKISLQLKYDFGLSCRIYAGCDMFLMPSLFEPNTLKYSSAERSQYNFSVIAR